MTPQERQLVDELFDRLAQLEGQPRDPQAERAIADGLARAPHALYPLVQTVLVQDEALKAAEEHIRALSGEAGAPQQERGFLDSVRDALLGPDPRRRGSVPEVRPNVWNAGAQPPQQPMQPMQDYGRGGGSFLGTAAAAAAGVIGGSLLFNSLRSMMGGDQAQARHSAFGDAGRDSAWGSGRDSELAREAGLNDIGGGAREERQGIFDSPDLDSDFGGDGGGGDAGGGGGD
jgi:hypothetical protein